MERVLKLHFLKDRGIILLFNLIKLGYIINQDDKYKGFGLVFGIWRFEFQFNTSIYLERFSGGVGNA